MLPLLFSLSIPSVASPASLTVATTPIPCASSAGDLPNDLSTAFAYDLESPSLLHFISALATVPPRLQRGAFDAAVASDATPAERDVEAAVSARCRTLDEIYGSSRAAYLVVNEWRLGELADAKRFETFLTVATTALSALADGDALSAEQRAAAMQPFAAVLARAEPSPLPSASGTCTQPDRYAETLHIVEPSYPPLAASGGTGGIVQIKLSISDTGGVRYGRVFSDTLRNGVGAQDIVRASILAAVATTYAPALKDCRPIAGQYLFRADYRRK